MTLAGFHHIAAYTALSKERLIPQPSQVRHAQDRSPALNRRLLSAIGKEEVKRSSVDSLNPTNLSEETLATIASLSNNNSYEEKLEIYNNENQTNQLSTKSSAQKLSLYI